mmetsp:Transcript_2479/g.2428  ORF Transcript_2479/g.2428 Transcript_2479/m.2428 type:complete len:207 (+) Transcript_2479:661-1281(+)|eukprot:CAMPEP_0170542014 /NCGR_PEP_ID=MMETSP0211-20121228/1575_1 /TAXON_ID=311385 /ORGANISM="Pseudokeronopsis sp., Strain OXSARD2" /LENGTH=206 /DNA_ID=CAMNT_0010844945 /DNA_START=660 /DNA_END=1280 /DNA_ORIENTATION=+
MFCIVCGLAFMVFGEQGRVPIIQTFLLYSIFILTLAYGYEVFRLSYGLSLILALGTTSIGMLFIRKPERVNLVSAIGLTIGLSFGLFLSSLFDIRNQALLYPLLLASTILGGACYFKGDIFFCYASTFVVTLVTVEGISNFLDEEQPRFIESVQETIEGNFDFLIVLGAYMMICSAVFVLGLKNQLKMIQKDIQLSEPPVEEKQVV